MITSPYIPCDIRNFNSLDDDNSESEYKPLNTPEMVIDKDSFSGIESNKKPSQTQNDLNNGEVKVNEEKETADKTLSLISNNQTEEIILSPNMDLPEPILEYIVGSFSVNKKLILHSLLLILTFFYNHLFFADAKLRLFAEISKDLANIIA